MRPIWIVGIILGALILYTGMFGSQGWGLTLIPRQLPWKEEFDSFNDWTTGDNNLKDPIINPAGQLEMRVPVHDPAGVCACVNFGAGATLKDKSVWTMRTNIIINQYGDDTSNPGISMWMYFTAGGINYYLYYDLVQYFTRVGTHYDMTHNDMNSHVYTTVVDTLGKTYSVYQDAHLIWTSNLFTLPSGPRSDYRLSLDAHGPNEATTVTLIHIEYIRLYEGNWPPGTDPESQVTDVGSLNVHTKLNNAACSVAVKVEGPDIRTVTSQDGVASFTSLPVGAYTVSGTYTFNQEYREQSVTIAKDASAEVTLDFTPSQVNTGTLKVYSTMNGASVSGVFITVTGPQTKTGTTVNGATVFSLTPGDYMISATYNNVPASGSRTVVANGLAEITLDFTSQQQQTGTLIVTAHDSNGGLVVAHITVSGTTSKDGYTTTDPLNPLKWSDIPPGQVSLTAKYTPSGGSEQSLSKQVTVSLGGSVSPDFTFTASSGGDGDGDGDGGGGWDWSQIPTYIMNWIRSMLNNPSLRQLMLIGGGLLTVISGIMFVIPEKKASAPVVVRSI